MTRFGDITYQQRAPWPRTIDPPKLPPLRRPWRPDEHEAQDDSDDGPSVWVRIGEALETALNIAATVGVMLTFEEVILLTALLYGKQIGPVQKFIGQKLAGHTHQHHTLVQELMKRFYRRGLNPHLFTLPLNEDFHRYLHKTGWNEVWKTFFTVTKRLTGRDPSAPAIAEFLGQMLDAWGVPDVDFETFNRMKAPQWKD